MLDPEFIDQLVDFFIDEGALGEGAEITIEANPEDITPAFAKRLAHTWVNRISLGAQSLNDALLKALGRNHSALSIKTAIDELNQAGFTNISVDLILGMEGENVYDTQASLRYLNDKKIPHISAYLLTVEEKTHFAKLIEAGRMKGPDEDTQVEIYRAVQRELNDLCYGQYDISSYAKPGFRSRHNQIYWAKGSYLGLGPAAHSMRLLPDGSVERAQNKRDLKSWLSQDHSQNIERLNPHEALKEALAFGLRNMADGIKPEMLAKRHQVELPSSFLGLIQRLEEQGLLDITNDSIKITAEGALFADSIMRDILGA